MTVKFSKDTSTILKNFSAINQSLIFNEGVEGTGTIIKTVSGAKNVFGSVTIPEVMPQAFAVYDLNAFLRCQEDLFADPVLTDFKENSVTIRDADLKLRSKTNYYFTDQKNISSPKKDIKFPATDASFEVTEAQVSAIVKAANVLQRPYIGFVSDGKEISVKAFDFKQKVSNDFSLVIGETEVPEFVAFMSVDSLKILPGAYTVDVSSKKITRFTSKDVESLVYFIALEGESFFSS